MEHILCLYTWLSPQTSVSFPCARAQGLSAFLPSYKHHSIYFLCVLFLFGFFILSSGVLVQKFHADGGNVPHLPRRAAPACRGWNQVVEWPVCLMAFFFCSHLLAHLKVEKSIHLPKFQEACICSPELYKSISWFLKPYGLLWWSIAARSGYRSFFFVWFLLDCSFLRGRPMTGF